MATRQLATKPADVRILTPNESLGDMSLYYMCEKVPVPEKIHVPNQKNKKASIREKHLHSNKFMRTADVMTGFSNIKAERQLIRNNCL